MAEQTCVGPPATHRTTPENLVILIRHLTEPLPEPRDPTEAEMDAWLASLDDGGAE